MRNQGQGLTSDQRWNSPSLTPGARSQPDLRRRSCCHPKQRSSTPPGAADSPRTPLAPPPPSPPSSPPHHREDLKPENHRQNNESSDQIPRGNHPPKQIERNAGLLIWRIPDRGTRGSNWGSGRRIDRRRGEAGDGAKRGRRGPKP
jgi:hypothetical protein